MDGVIVVIGPALRDWMRSLGDGALAEDQVAEGWSTLEGHIARRDGTQRSLHPLTVSVVDWVARLALAVGSAALGLTALGQILNGTQSVALTLTLACAFILPGGFLMRSQRGGGAPGAGA